MKQISMSFPMLTGINNLYQTTILGEIKPIIFLLNILIWMMTLGHPLTICTRYKLQYTILRQSFRQIHFFKSIY
jgi:hypothetical protein